jgi:hypothetical protein
MAISNSAELVKNKEQITLSAACYYLYRRINSDSEASTYLEDAVKDMISETGITIDEATEGVKYVTVCIAKASKEKSVTYPRKGVETLFLDILATRGRWYGIGMPSVQLGHRLASSFAVTSISEDVLNGLKPPFSEFLIEVPTGMLQIESMSVESILFTKQSVKATEIEEAYSCWSMYLLLSGSTEILVLSGEEPKHLLNYTKAIGNLPENSRFNKVIELAGRILINVMLWMTGGSRIKQVGKGHEYWSKSGNRHRHGEDPTRRVFQLTSDIKHDFRSSVTSYLKGDRRSISVQFVVSGHWKMQPCGLRGSQRKYIFIEPYWKGDAESPIANRKHKLE